MGGGSRRFAVLGLILVLAACGGRAADGDAAPRAAQPTSDPAELVQSFASVQLPESTAELEVHEFAGIDQVVGARFTIAGADLDGFLADGGFPMPPEPGYRTIFGGENFGWDLDELDQFLGSEDRVDGVVRHLMIDIHDPDRPVVYLEAFTT